jgi:flagellar protein FlaJ
MSFIKSSLKLKKRASSRVQGSGYGVQGTEDNTPNPEPRTPDPEKKATGSQRNLQFDLFAQLTYMAAVSTAGVSRSQLFDYASNMPYSSSRYFRQVHLLAQKLNIDYAEGCRMVAEKTNMPEVKGFLLRLAGSLGSGETESDFLLREAEAIGETYGNQYERDTESLKKWTDAYVTLVVASGLIVIVSVISMMIYDVGVPIIVGLALTMVFVTCLGSWIIYASAPREVKTRSKGASSDLQLLGVKLFKLLTPAGVMVCALMLLMKIDLGYVMLTGAAILFVPGFIIGKDDKNIAKKDADVPTVVRVLGGVTSAIGTTVTEALSQVDHRSMGNLMPEITRLRQRLNAGIKPSLCWKRLVDETGSELIDRTVTMFWDSINMGGEPGKVGMASALYSSKIVFLRATRTMVAATFKWLILPLHAAMVGLLQFIPEIMTLFTQQIKESSEALTQSSSSNLPNSDVPIGQIFAFGNVNLQMVSILVLFVTIALTVANSFAPKAAEGGHNLKVVYNLAVNMALTGVLMVAVPMFARAIFKSVVGS